MSFKVAIASNYSFADPAHFEFLRRSGFDLTTVEMHLCDEAETIERMRGFNAVIAMGETFTARALDEMKGDLRFIIRHGIGYDKIDVEHAASLGICCCNTPGTMSTGVAELAVTMMLELTRGFYRLHADMAAGKWNKGPMMNQLEGSNVGLVGFGNIARRVARYLSGFGCHIIAYDKYFSADAAAQLGVREATLDEVLGTSDFVSVHLPLLPDTAKLINAETLGKMKPGAFLINTSRGGLVDEPTLIYALKNGVIAGAGLDVYTREPLPADSELRALPNVFLTPHAATRSYQCVQAGFEGIVFAMNEFLAGKVPAFCVNKDYVNHIAPTAR